MFGGVRHSGFVDSVCSMSGPVAVKTPQIVDTAQPVPDSRLNL